MGKEGATGDLQIKVTIKGEKKIALFKKPYYLLKPGHARIGFFFFCDLVPVQFLSAIHFYTTIVNRGCTQTPIAPMYSCRCTFIDS